jgi:hypothetical protein
MRTDRLSDPLIVDHYRGAAIESGPSMRPMLSLVEVLATKEYAANVPAGTSHDILVLGGEHKDNVTVAFLPHVQSFDVRYVDGRTGKSETHKVDIRAVESLVDSLVLRLLVRSRDDSAA